MYVSKSFILSISLGLAVLVILCCEAQADPTSPAPASTSKPNHESGADKKHAAPSHPRKKKHPSTTMPPDMFGDVNKKKDTDISAKDENKEAEHNGEVKSKQRMIASSGTLNIERLDDEILKKFLVDHGVEKQLINDALQKMQEWTSWMESHDKKTRNRHRAIRLIDYANAIANRYLIYSDKS